MHQQAKWGLLGLLVWSVLSVPVAVMVGKAIKAQLDPEETPEPPEPEDPLALLDRLEFLGNWEQLGLLVRQGRPVLRGNRGPRAIRDRKAMWGPLDQQDQ